MQMIQSALLVPRDGMMSIGNTKATIIPLIMIELMLLNTASTPR